jgi:diaminopimelate epimerase
MVVDAPTEGGDYKMLFFNSDGSMGEMCGNGARCICRYGFENGLAGEVQRVETVAGLVTGQRISQRLYRIRLNDPSVIDLDRSVSVNGVRYECAYVELGNPGLPHAVVPYPNLKNADEHTLRELGRALRWHPAFPKGANINFYEITGEDEVYERTFERGVEDFTYACGTGTGSVGASLAVSAARIRAGQEDAPALKAETAGKVMDGAAVHSFVLHMAGGTLTVDVVLDGENGDHVKDLYLSGPTNIVAIGEVKDEELSVQH